MKSFLYILFLALLAACGSSTQPKEQPMQSTTDEQSTTTEAQQISVREISYSTDSTTMNGYLASPANAENAPGVLIVHEWWGHNEYTRQRAEMLAKMGYVAFAIDMYGDGKQAGHPKDAGKFAGQVFSNMSEAKARFEAALNQLKAQPGVNTEKIAAIGYCFGGSVALTMANAGYDLAAVAAFHSGVQLPIMPGTNLKAKVLVANGADDPMVSAESVTNFKTAMDATGIDYKYISYEGAVHAFTNPGATALGEKFQLPLAYNEEADKASWEELKILFDSAF